MVYAEDLTSMLKADIIISRAEQSRAEQSRAELTILF